MIIDLYTLKARLQPGLLVVLPAILGTISWVSVSDMPYTFFWSLLGLTGFTFLWSHITREQGKRIERLLWETWGGKPTTQRLSHRSAPNQIILCVYHEKLSTLLGKKFPSVEEERNNSAAAHEIYDAAVTILRNKTRDSKAYPLIFKELANYGFRRNIFGMRSAGIVISILGLAASSGAIIQLSLSSQIALVAWICTVLNSTLLCWWIFRIKNNWVKQSGFDYADRLLESCEGL